jgi:hypothetical protein
MALASANFSLASVRRHVSSNLIWLFSVSSVSSSEETEEAEEDPDLWSGFFTFFWPGFIIVSRERGFIGKIELNLITYVLIYARFLE